MKTKKVGQTVKQKIRRRSALGRLETRLAETKAGKYDEAYGEGKERAIKRMENEIGILKSRI